MQSRCKQNESFLTNSPINCNYKTSFYKRHLQQTRQDFLMVKLPLEGRSLNFHLSTVEKKNRFLPHFGHFSKMPLLYLANTVEPRYSDFFRQQAKSHYRRSQYCRSTSLHKYVVKLFSATFLMRKKIYFEINLGLIL